MSDAQDNDRNDKVNGASPRSTLSGGVELVWPRAPHARHGTPGTGPRIRQTEMFEGAPSHKRKGWFNRLIHGDNLLAAEALLDKFAGRIDMIYIDPPFATGSDFSLTSRIAGKEVALTKAYRDTWESGLPSWLSMMENRLRLIYDLLSERGSLYVHLDYRTSAAVRFLLDSIFGPRCFINEIIWHYKTGGLPEKLGFGRKHDNILFYVKDPAKATWNPQKEKSYLMHRYGFSNVRIHSDRNGEYTLVNCRDVFTIPALRGNQPERVDYPTQKPEALLERMILASTNEDDLVADLFCGSGTTVAVAERLGRRWIGCDIGTGAIHTTRKRLFGIDTVGPFRIYDLGREERRAWIGGNLPENGGKKEMEWYRSTLLDLYGADRSDGGIHIHGRMGDASVSIGPPDRPVSGLELEAACEECARAGSEELHLLGWEFETGIVENAAEEGVPFRLFRIPREAIDPRTHGRDGIFFRELALLSCTVSAGNGRSATVRIDGFRIPGFQSFPDKVKNLAKTWSDLIDQWSVDWNWNGETFTHSWTAYRTRRNMELSFTSKPHIYKKVGDYKVMVRVVDVFGDETSRVIPLTIR